MSKNLYIALLLSCSQLAADTFEDRIWKEFQESIEQMNKRFEAIEKSMNVAFVTPPTTQTATGGKELSAQKTNNTIVVSTKTPTITMTTDNDFVIVNLNLGELNAQEISIEAEKNTLDGKVPLKNGSATFSVQNGRLFELSLKQEQKKEEKNEQGQAITQQFASAASTKIESLPDVVTDLEKTKVSYKKGVIELRLPKIAAQKKGTKLNVVTN